jgi:hypothetical protein
LIVTSISPIYYEGAAPVIKKYHPSTFEKNPSGYNPPTVGTTISSSSALAQGNLVEKKCDLTFPD